MNLKNKKRLIARTLGVGMQRVRIVPERIEEVKELLTKQDIRDLVQAGAIVIKEIHGRRTIVKSQSRRGPGKIKKKINNRKRDYVRLTRKLREYTRQLHLQKKIEKTEYLSLRKKIKSKLFKSKAHLKESLKTK